jgi:hypothetical protein
VIAILLIAQIYSLSPRAQWEQFKTKYNRQYGASEEVTRYKVFKNNLRLSQKLDSYSPYARFGVTKFSDLSPSEFAEKFLRPMGPAPAPNQAIEDIQIVDVPTAFDWTTANPKIVTPVYNQGDCGSCWAFSGTEAMESARALLGLPLQELSMQEMVDCDNFNGSSGCDGGWPYSTYEYVQKSGIESLAKYPYTAMTDKCARNQADNVNDFEVTGYKSYPKNETALLSTLYSLGPVSMAMDANILQFYVEGIIDLEPCGDELDHALIFVGFGIGEHLFQDIPFWRIKNSWGASWGEKGFFRIIRDKDKCGIADALTLPMVSKPKP